MKVYLSLLLLFFSTQLLAVPALPHWQWHRQADGSMIEVRLCGDEHFSWHELRDGTPVVLSGNNFCYAKVSDGRLVSSNTIARNDASNKTLVAASTNDVAFLRRQTIARFQEVAKAAKKNSFTETAENSKANGGKRNIAARRAAVQGHKKGILILVQFTDKKFRDTLSVRSFYNRRMNESGYTDNDGAIGSVHDYFLDQSNGQFNLTFDVVGPITLPHNMAYYGAPSDYNNDVRPGQMVVDACNAVKDSVNFADYDWDGDGEVDQVFVLFAGEGQATSNDDNTIWPHEWTLQDANYYERSVHPLSIDGVTVNRYACGNELVRMQVQRGAQIRYRTFNMGIGVVCHEFSHCLGFPDLYDQPSDSNAPSFFGMGNWDIMDVGCYNGAPTGFSTDYAIGIVPAGYTSYERSYLGWLTPTDLENEQVNVSELAGLSDGGGAYRIVNPQHKDEYFLLENRSNSRWDSQLFGHGLLVLHVDYHREAWEYNIVNNATYNDNPYLTFIPADNSQSYRNENGDAFPYVDRDSITATSTPTFTLYNGTADRLHCSVTNIALADDGTVSFTYTPAIMTGISQATVSAPTKTGNTTKAGNIYTIDGKLIPKTTSTDALPHGMYIVEKDGKRIKIVK